MSDTFYAKPIVELEIEKLRLRASALKIKPSLKVLLVGNNPSSILYVNNKLRFCKKINAHCEIIKVKESVAKDDFIQMIKDISSDKNVTGLLVQLPLPNHLANIEYSSLIPSEKDVDGFTEKNIFSLYNAKANINKISLPPCTPAGIVRMANFYGVNFSGKSVAILGRSLIVGKPLSLLLTNKDATVTLCHSKTANLKEITKSSDIIISAMGLPHFITKEFISNNKNQIIFDVGISRLNNKTVGDVEFEKVKHLVKGITPVPGGIGPMTILSLGHNLIATSEFQNNI